MVEFVGDIVSGRLGPGAALPREVAVAERFSISRGVARETLRALEERGLVTVRHGSATTVNARQHWELFDEYVLVAALESPLALELLNEYLECRRIIEIQAAGFAAERRTTDALQTIRACLGDIEEAVAVRDARRHVRAYHDADVAFHVAVVDAGGNAALSALVRRIDTALLTAHYPLARPAYRRTRALPEHRAILDAIIARDPHAAQHAMRAHLEHVEDVLREHAHRVARAA